MLRNLSLRRAAIPEPWRAALVGGGVMWIASLAMYAIVTTQISRLTETRIRPPARMFSSWYQWDTVNYIYIAEHGYAQRPGDPAFFPVFPLLIRWLNPVLPGGPLVTAVAISTVFCLAALVLIHRFTESEFDRPIARRTVFYVMAFPTGFFLVAGYNESIFIAASVAAMYAARRGNFWVAGIAGALASGTRTFGVLLLVPLGLEYLRQRGGHPRGWRVDLLGLALVPVGLAAYVGYCWHAFGDPMRFSHAQAMWHRMYGWPGKALVDAFGEIGHGSLFSRGGSGNLTEIGAVLFAIALLVLSVVGPWRLRRDQYPFLAWTVLPLVMICTTSVGYDRPLMSAVRYVIEFVPLFIVLAKMGERMVVDRTYLIISIGLQATLLVAFLSQRGLVG